MNRSDMKASWLKLLDMDLRYGLRRCAPRLALLSLATNILCFMYFAQIATGGVAASTPTFADYFSACLAGTIRQPSLGDEALRLPAGWLCLCSCCAYIVFDYPAHDLESSGRISIVLSGSRSNWWLSKCTWIALACFISWLVIIVVCLLWSFSTGSVIDKGALNISPETPALLGFDAPYVHVSNQNITLFLFTAPISLIALCMVQATIGMATTPYIGFIVTLSVLLISVLYTSNLLPGNHLMLARCQLISDSGLSLAVGVLIAVILCAVSLVTGIAICKRLNIQGKEFDAS